MEGLPAGGVGGSCALAGAAGLPAGAAVAAGAGVVLLVLGAGATRAGGVLLWLRVWVCVGAAAGLPGITAAGARIGSDGIGSPG
jgi:hypothetical protein